MNNENVATFNKRERFYKNTNIIKLKIMQNKFDEVVAKMIAKNISISYDNDHTIRQAVA